MSRFPTPGHLASWARVTPGLNQSGERRKPARTRHGDHWLTGALGIAAMVANRTQDTTFLGARLLTAIFDAGLVPESDAGWHSYTTFRAAQAMPCFVNRRTLGSSRLLGSWPTEW
jgi:hypothetical protein